MMGMVLALQSPVRQKSEEEKAVKLGISLSRRTYDALIAKSESGPFRIKISQIIERALMNELGLTNDNTPDPEGK